MWSSLEVSLDVVAACLPVIAPGLYRLARTGALSWSHVMSMLMHPSRNRTVIEKDHLNGFESGEEKEEGQKTASAQDGESKVVASTFVYTRSLLAR